MGKPVAKKPTNIDKPVKHDVAKSTPSSTISVIIPIIAILVALIAPMVTLGLLVLDANKVCSVIPGICQGLYLAVPVAPSTSQLNNTPYSTSVSLEFFNRLDTSIDTYWKDYAGEEQFWFTMEPYSYTGNISSIRGHVWSFRNSDNQELIFEEEIDLRHCGKIHIAPPEHIEALRQHCATTGNAIIGYWPRAPLVRKIPKVQELGSVKVITADAVQFGSYEGRLKSDVHEIELETISISPHMLRVQNFLSEEECDHLIEISAGKLEPGSPLEASSTWLEHGESPIVSAITRRIFEIMGFEANIETFYFAEKIQVTRYESHQEYLPHYDAMDVTTLQRTLPHNRFATITLYLNTVDEADGGTDVWPRANGANEFARAPCDSEYRIQPSRGTMVIMYSMFGDGNIDESSLHGSCPVTVDDKEKWTANMYFWDPFVQWSSE